MKSGAAVKSGAAQGTGAAASHGIGALVRTDDGGIVPLRVVADVRNPTITFCFSTEYSLAASPIYA